jgi:hypothetical protein
VLEIVAALAFVGAVTVGGLGTRDRRSRGRAWQTAARGAGLEAVELRSRGGWPVRLEGRRGALAVTISSYRNRQRLEAGTRIRISGVTRGLGIQVWDGARTEAADATPTGDGAFDRAMVVAGDPVLAAALLDERTRGRVHEMFAHQATYRGRDSVIDMGARLDPGYLVAERAVGDQPVWLATYLRDLLDLADRLRDPDDIEERLVANLRTDAGAGVRVHNLRVLLARSIPSGTRDGALRIAMGDVDEQVRLEAALAAGGEGRGTLLALALETTTTDAFAASAVQALGDALPTDEARALLERSLGAARPRTLEALLESLSARGPEQQDVIGHALAAVEGDLLPIAARALGRVGTAPSIVLLREAEARWPRHSGLRDAVREAAASIRSRLVGAEEGQMSLAESHAEGRLSVATAGQVSLPAVPAADDERT